MKKARKRQIIAATSVHMAVEKSGSWCQLRTRQKIPHKGYLRARLPLPSRSMCRFMIPKATKSVHMTTTVTIHATAVTSAAPTAPMSPDPAARRKAMKARPHATGCRTMTRVRALVVSVDAVLKSVLSAPSMILAGL